MPVATMTSKGQITVPKEVRDDLHLTAGSKVMFVKLPNGQYRIVARTGTVEDFIGLLHDPRRKPMTIEEINDAIAEGGAESGLRGMA
ncbi:AbrB/MazE/SpoVT family DNA-binding domain-containing protein [Agromyces sp. H66]|uniref:AbrB/MazE/SpoVT family DNA-binding domain-containing protein n=1 Tax=Agromyces sp. H66 TaxID=2529859 RepID=UPI0020BDADE7|nr:AbrB/MazE/SpoVT family DNA-binding domain-containing protein [Agromyces sp. H66]